MITTRAWEGGPKEHRAKQNWQCETHSCSYICTRALHAFRCLAHCRAASTVTPLLPKATTPSIQPNLGLPCTRPPLTSAINTLLAIRYSSILSRCPNHLNTHWSAILANPVSIPALLRTSSFLSLSILDTPTKHLKYFISRIFTFLLSALLIPHASAPYNAVGTIITPSYRHLLAFISYPLLLFSAPHALYPSFILCITSLSHPLSAATCDPRYLKQSTSSHGSTFSITCILSPLPYLEHLITLLLPTFTINLLLSHTLPNSITNLHNFSSESATSAVSSANNSWFISNLPQFALQPFIYKLMATNIVLASIIL